MAEDSLHHRLRRLGEVEVDRVVAASHLNTMAGVRPRRVTTSAAVALALTIGGSATAVGVSLAVQEPSSVSTGAAPHAASTAAIAVARNDVAAPAARPPSVDSDPCVGPPPFAGIVPVDGRTRAAEATEFARIRAMCHLDDTTTSTTTTSTTNAQSVGTRRVVRNGPPVSVP